MASQPFVRLEDLVAWSPAVTSYGLRLIESCPTFSSVLQRPREQKPWTPGEASVCVLVGCKPRKRKSHDCNKLEPGKNDDCNTLAFQEALTMGPEGHPLAVIGVVFLSAVSDRLHLTCHHPSCGIAFDRRLKALQAAMKLFRSTILTNPTFANAKAICFEIATLEGVRALLAVFDRLELQWNGEVRSDGFLVRAATHSLIVVVDKFVGLDKIESNVPQHPTTMPVTTEVIRRRMHVVSQFKCDGPFALGALSHEALRESLRGVIGVATAGRRQVAAAAPIPQLEQTSSPFARLPAACAAKPNVWTYAPYSPLSPRHNNVAGLMSAGPSCDPRNATRLHSATAAPLQALALDAERRPSIVVAVERCTRWTHTPYLPLHASGPLLDELAP